MIEIKLLILELSQMNLQNIRPGAIKAEQHLVAQLGLQVLQNLSVTNNPWKIIILFHLSAEISAVNGKKIYYRLNNKEFKNFCLLLIDDKIRF